MDEHMPQKRMTVRETDVPYMTTEWKQAIRNKRKYAQIYAKSRTPENWENKRKWRTFVTFLFTFCIIFLATFCVFLAIVYASFYVPEGIF